MSTARESIEVAVPPWVAYEQLSHFENYPQFMSGVMSLAPIDASTAHMVLDIGGNRAEFDARITETRPGEFLCWEAMDGPQVSEALRLEPMAGDRTRVVAELQIDARELMPAEQHAVDVLNRRLKTDLKGFKRFCEESVARTDATANAATRATPASITRGIASASGLTSEAKASDAKASQAKASQAKASQAKASQAKASDAKVGEAKVGEAKAHASNERPVHGVPAGGNLGPMQHPVERNARTRQAQPGAAHGRTDAD